MRVGRASETFQRRPVLKVAVLGASGAGKTEWAARSPRPLILLTEPQGKASIVAACPDAMVIDIETWEDFRGVMNAVKVANQVTIDGGEPALEATIDGHTIVFQTLVVDSFTDLQRLMINRVAGVESGVRDRLDLDGGAINMGFEKWGLVTSACESVWAQQRNLPCNTVFLFLAEEKIDDAQQRSVVPMLSGQKLPYSMGQYFNAVGLAAVRRLGDGSSQHVIRWSVPGSPTKPAPGWPTLTVNTRTPGQTTLGSLLAFSYPGLMTAREPDDDASFVQGAAVHVEPAQAQQTSPAQAAEPFAQAPARRRRV